MYHLLVNHNEDIKQLVDKGYAVGFDSSHLVIRDIPYLDSSKNLQIGAIVSKLNFLDEKTVKMINHEIFFCGSHPCEINGTPINNLAGGVTTIALDSEDLKVERSFSNKPANDFANLFDKIESYVTIFCGPAMTLFEDATPLTFRTNEVIAESVFKFNDTLTSRAELGDLALNFKEDVIAIIGLGGTGSYILDFLVKTPVKEIRGFDIDYYHVHNAFRSPGKLEQDELNKRKSVVYKNRYDNFRHGLTMHTMFVDADSTEDIAGATFAFVCVDKGSSRKGIFDLLIKLGIPFIDVGMGLNRNKGPITGTLRTTYYPSESAKELQEKQLAPMTDDPNEVYRNNIQLSEVNALNASLAVMKYKQLRGFYQDDKNYYNSLLSLYDFHMAGESL